MSLDPRLNIARTISLAGARACCHDPEAFTDACDLLSKALVELEALRFPMVDPVAVAIGRACQAKPEGDG